MATIAFLVALLIAAPVLGWDGYDWENGTDIEIEKGNRVRSGADIEFFDSDAGEDREGTVESIDRFGDSVELEVLDEESGELRTFDMEGE